MVELLNLLLALHTCPVRRCSGKSSWLLKTGRRLRTQPCMTCALHHCAAIAVQMGVRYWTLLLAWMVRVEQPWSPLASPGGTAACRDQVGAEVCSVYCAVPVCILAAYQVRIMPIHARGRSCWGLPVFFFQEPPPSAA